MAKSKESLTKQQIILLVIVTTLVTMAAGHCVGKAIHLAFHLMPGFNL